MKESCKLLKAALKKGIVADEVVYAKVIYCLCREGCLDEALELCKEMELKVLFLMRSHIIQ